MNPTVILLLCITSYVKADASASLDDPKFATLGKHFAGTPSLLVSLAAKEEVVRMILSNFRKELREGSINETMLGALSYDCDDQLDLVERWEIRGLNPVTRTVCNCPHKIQFQYPQVFEGL